MPEDMNEEEYNERPIDVEPETSGTETTSVPIPEAQQKDEAIPQMTRSSKRRSKFFKKSYLRKTL